MLRVEHCNLLDRISENYHKCVAPVQNITKVLFKDKRKVCYSCVLGNQGKAPVSTNKDRRKVCNSCVLGAQGKAPMSTNKNKRKVCKSCVLGAQGRTPQSS